MSAKARILGRITQSVGGRESAETRRQRRDRELQEVSRRYQIAGELDEAARIELFKTRLVHSGAAVHEARSSEIRTRIGELLEEKGKRIIVIPPGVPDEWIPSGVTALRNLDVSNKDLDNCHGVLTGCTLAVAETGTIVLTGGLGEGPRKLTLLPDYHLCVVKQEQIHQTFPEAIRALSAAGTHPITLFSGPSGTVDIEMVKVKGVHGPRVVDVLVARVGCET
jgi:L-lactate dehydrogenase complex protein LldG